MAVRDKKGKFQAGTRGDQSPNPKGRGPRAVEAGCLELFKRAVSDEDRTAIIETATRQAIRGDQKAREFIFDRLFGPPVQRTETELTGGVNIEVLGAIISKVYDKPDPT